MPDLESLLGRLIGHRVEFVLVGGFAAVAHGVTLLTQDINICCPFTPQNLRCLEMAISDLHPVHRLTPDRVPLNLETQGGSDLKNLYLDTDFGPLDCLSTVKGIGSYDQAVEKSIEADLANGRCQILSIDGLIRAKEEMGRSRDKLAILQLKAIRDRPC